MEAKLDKFVRTKSYENSEAIGIIKKRIQEEVEAILGKEAGDLRKENERLYAEEKEFRAKAKEIIVKAFKDKSLVGVSTQTGPHGSLICDYVGKIVHIYSSGDCFDLVDPNAHEGRSFTIGSSCLLSIKIL